MSDLLTTYAIYDQDLGYVQGMSDIAVVILDIYDEDHVAFWVFAKLMQRIRGNFEKSQKAIKLQVNINLDLRFYWFRTYVIIMS